MGELVGEGGPDLLRDGVATFLVADVLVSQRDGGVLVARDRHELRQRRTRARGPRQGRVPQIVDVQVVQPHLLAH